MFITWTIFNFSSKKWTVFKQNYHNKSMTDKLIQKYAFCQFYAKKHGDQRQDRDTTVQARAQIHANSFEHTIQG